MGRHRHAVNVRADGLATVLGPLARDPRIRVAVLFDVDSGMVLDAYRLDGYPPDAAGGDTELIGATHAELMRTALGVVHSAPGAGLGCELLISPGGDRHHLLRAVPDPHGDRLALSVVVDGPPRVVERVRRRLAAISAHALTAGPSPALRPGPDGWVASGIDPSRAAVPSGPDPSYPAEPPGEVTTEPLVLTRVAPAETAAADADDGTDPTWSASPWWGVGIAPAGVPASPSAVPASPSAVSVPPSAGEDADGVVPPQVRPREPLPPSRRTVRVSTGPAPPAALPPAR